MKMRIILLLILAFLVRNPFAFGQTADCSNFHSGLFHVYFPTSRLHYLVERDNQMQKEVLEGNTDTLFSHLNWLDDCDFTLQYFANGNPLSKEQEKFFKHHKLFCHLEPAGTDFCVYTESADDIRGQLMKKDTLWLHEVSQAAYTPVLMRVRSESILRGMHFSDTSRYAVVYIYRSKTGTFPGAAYNIFVEGNPICAMSNNSSYIFAVYRKGPLLLTSRFSQDTSAISLDLEAGKSYYLKTEMEIGIFDRRNYHVLLKLMPPEKGKKQFDRTFVHTIW